MRRIGTTRIVLTVLGVLTLASCATMQDLDLGDVMGGEAPLDEATVIRGLKQALSVGTERTVDQVGALDGYLGDELLRILVLWLTLAGAVAASRADRHISIAVLDRFLSGRLLDAARAFIHLFTAGICGLLCWHSVAFVRLSHEFGDRLLGDVPAWLLQLALPIGFGLMTWRHLVHALRYALGRAACSYLYHKKTATVIDDRALQSVFQDAMEQGRQAAREATRVTKE